MDEMKVLVVNLDGNSGMGPALCRVLESCAQPRMQIRSESAPLNNDDLFDLLADFRPELLFPIFSSIHKSRVRELIQSVNHNGHKVPILVVSQDDNPDDMTTFLKLGVIDFITPPIKSVDVLPRIWRWLEQKRPDKQFLHSVKEMVGLKQLVGKDPAFLAEIDKIPLVANCDATVLILGETGTGKELFARAIHYLSPRCDKPFIASNCGAILAELVENELFGHMQGAFTGADSKQGGIISEAEKGTLFLDEIDSLPLHAQVKLTRFLQYREYKPLGSSKLQQADLRIIAATNVNLLKAVKEGKFREDLYYRLNVLPLVLPPLCERRVDIPLLARHFLAKYTAEMRKPVEDFCPEALRKLMAYDWSGNVRELENVIERAVVFSRKVFIESDDVGIYPLQPPNAPPEETFRATKSRLIAQFERKYIEDLLRAHSGNVTEAAKAAHKNRRAFWELVRKYKIDADSFRLRSH